MVLATGAGSVIASHVNDHGFWLFKGYFNLTVGETLRTDGDGNPYFYYGFAGRVSH